MITTPWKAFPTVAILCFGMAPITALAQQPTKAQAPVRVALLEPPPPASPASDPGASAGSGEQPATSPAPASASVAPADTQSTSPSTSATAPVDRDQLIQQMSQEMVEMKQ